MYAQSPCLENISNEEYIDEIVNLNKGPRNTLLVLKLPDRQNTIKRYLISSRDFAKLINVNYYIDTSFAGRVKSALEGNINFPIDTVKLKNYLIPDMPVSEKVKPCKVYKGFFNKDGFPKKGAIIYYDWGEYPAILSSLIDNYSIIIADDLLGIYVYRKPCCR